MGYFHVVLLPLAYGTIEPGRPLLNILQKSNKKIKIKYLALVTQTIDFIVFM